MRRLFFATLALLLVGPRLHEKWPYEPQVDNRDRGSEPLMGAAMLPAAIASLRASGSAKAGWPGPRTPVISSVGGFAAGHA